MRRLFQAALAAVAGSLVLHSAAGAALAPDLPTGAATNRLSLLEAIRHTLLRDTSIRLTQQQVEAAKGAAQTAAGQFDTSLASVLSRGWTHLPRTELDRVQSGFRDIDDAVSDITTYELRLRKQFRSGITISPGVEVNRFADNLDHERALNRANVSFIITVPLLRGFGRKATGAQEQAARANAEAAVLDLQQTIAARIFNTVSAYWRCLAAARQLEVWRISERQSADLVQAVQDLVKINELPVSELRQSEADYAAKSASRISAEDQFWQARVLLAQAVGVAPEQMAVPPQPAAEFPTPAMLPEAASAIDLFTASLERRADYRAAQKAQRSAELLEAAARQNLKPQLDLNLEAGYAGLDEGSQFRRYYGSLDPRLAEGPNLLGTISFDWPFRNRTARGILQQRQAAQAQAQIRVEELARNIHAGILSARSELRASFAEVEQAEVAAQKYAQAVQSELDKVRLKLASILDVITLAERWDTARLNAIAARASHAVALARYRFETGTLLQPGATVESPLTVEDLTTPPRALYPGGRQ